MLILSIEIGAVEQQQCFVLVMFRWAMRTLNYGSFWNNPKRTCTIIYSGQKALGTTSGLKWRDNPLNKYGSDFFFWGCLHPPGVTPSLGHFNFLPDVVL